MSLKLHKGRTFLIAFAFFAILLVWQIYYYYMPLYLDELLINKFGPRELGYADIIGHIMSLDNLSALLIIPLFGYFSDRTKTRLGRRIPYIIAGCGLSLVLFPLISLMYIWNQFVWYFVIVVLLIICMSAWRSPYVSCMPDVTPKPLRTNANGIINFVGYLGAILGSGLTIVFTMNKPNLTIIPFIVTSVILLSVIIVFLLKFQENKLVAEVKPELDEGERLSDTLEAVEEDKKLSKRDKVNFVIISLALFFCWFAFHALSTFGSLYGQYLAPDNNQFGTCSMVLGLTSLISFLPSIWLCKKIGRKWSVVVGLAIVIIALVIGAVFVKSFGIVIILLFALSGIGWAIVMVNSYPMFVEMSTAKNVGRITGIYYFVSEGAKFITSNVSGYFYKWLGYDFYFIYAIIFMSLALVLCFFFRQKRKAHKLTHLKTPNPKSKK